MIAVLIIPAYLLLWGCAGRSDDHAGHDHSQESGEYAGHDHEAEGHDHEAEDHSGHDHAHEGEAADHDHAGETVDHAGHDHEAETEAEAGHAPGEIVFTTAQAQAAGLELETVRAEPFSQVIKTSGRIQAAKGDEVTVVATTGGVVSFANGSITEGSAIGKGQPIVTISAGGIAEGDPVLKARIAYEAASKEYARAQELVKDKIISQKEFEQKQTSYQTAKVAFEALNPNATATGVRVNAPIGGYIKNIYVKSGDYVSVGEPIATVSQNRRLQLRAEVSQKYFNDIKSVGSANFRMSYDDRVYRLADLGGKLLSFGKSSADDSFYIPVTFEFDNVGDVVPGAFAEVYLLSKPSGNVISLPRSAVVEEQGLYFVYVRMTPEDYMRREVVLGRSDGDRVEILSGLKAGEEAVIKGAYQLKLASMSSIIPEGHSHSH